MASWLVRSTPEQAVQVLAMTRDIILCSWARHFTVTDKRVPVNVILGGNPVMGLADRQTDRQRYRPIQGGGGEGIEILQVALCD